MVGTNLWCGWLAGWVERMWIKGRRRAAAAFCCRCWGDVKRKSDLLLLAPRSSLLQGTNFVQFPFSQSLLFVFLMLPAECRLNFSHTEASRQQTAMSKELNTFLLLIIPPLEPADITRQRARAPCSLSAFQKHLYRLLYTGAPSAAVAPLLVQEQRRLLLQRPKSSYSFARHERYSPEPLYSI